MEPKRLRAVKSVDVEPDVKPVPPTITDAVESGSPRDVWAAMRKKLAQAIDDGEVSSNAIASTYKELRELDRLIRQADAEAAAEEANKRDEVARRRSFNAAAI